MVTLIYSINLNAQQGVSTIGLQVKPILPINYFGAGDISVSDSIATIDISTKLGYSFGMVIRHSFTKSFSIESGINFTRRNYNITGSSSITGINDEADFGFISYEIPLQGLIYIRLGENLYMNTSAGLGINFYASNVKSKGDNYSIDHYSERARWINASFLSNLGLEFRSEKSGYFYFGASLNVPFNEITVTHLWWLDGNTVITEFHPDKYSQLFLNGNYFTVDLRYFLPQNKNDLKN